MQLWNRLTYQRKTVVFIAFALLLGYVAYARKISVTLEQRDQLSQLTNLADNETIEREISVYESELVLLDRILGKDRKDLESINREILNYVSDYADSTGIELVQMPKAHSFDDQGYRVYTHTVMLRGGYKKLLDLAYLFETQTSGMKLASVRYFSKKDPRTKKRELFAELYIQSYEKID